MYHLLRAYILGKVVISEEGMEKVLACFKTVTAQKDEILLGEGGQSRNMYFVINGCLRIYFLQADGSEATRYLAFEGNFASALMAFITEQPSLEYLQALEKSTLLTISREDFYRLVEEVPGWDLFYRNYLERAYVMNTNRLMSFITMDATERYQRLLMESPKIVQRLSNKMVANYLGISQEALSRLKSRLSKR
ncbi:Crp/Fnr family transcriptional regulator [Chitinophaga nivalis]|uniref:Crp/Fnr family transcriptional regulator n=1 Tax=Chitinophaga nivalis TaxID=2991709 RepID=A0ABT3IKU0_9BACT|nr:Crp/Fnr family transcriptional regulator [Chitinophaga nivalis]MCW3465773.1 Crp/Fnr family transcriptional regulator [Chitinophaga nivalis]MCW3484536.1 Crp/Fnr family transcriptional regulator [Chitinophaga nivalis]